MVGNAIILFKSNILQFFTTLEHCLEPSWYKRKLTAEDRKKKDCYTDKKTETERLREKRDREIERQRTEEREIER